MNEKFDKLMQDTMLNAENMIKKTKTKEEFLAVNGSLLAVVQRMYVDYMGEQETALLFYRIADRLAINKD